MAIKSPSTKMSANTTIAACVAVCIVMFIVLAIAGKAFYTRISHNARVLTKKQAAEKQLKTNLSNLPVLSDAYKNLGPTQDLVKQSLPDKPDFPSIIATMEVIAGASNVGLTSVSPLASNGYGVATTTTAATATTVPAASATAQTTGPQPYQFSIGVKGDYAGVVKFLSNLQLWSRPVTITGMQLNGDTDNLTGTINCQTYIFNPPILQDKTEAVK